MVTIPPVVTVACGALAWLFGVFLVRRIPVLSRYNLPAPVIGGLLVALVMTVLHERGLEVVKFNSQLVPPMMLAFFTTIGYGASVEELRRGGRAVLFFFIICSVLLLLQCAVGIVIARLFGEHALFGVLTSICALAGGPGTALSFAGVFEEAGVKGAAASGLSAAMLGIIAGGILGAPLATMLVQKHGLKPRPTPTGSNATVESESGSGNLSADLLYHIAIILIVGAIGFYLSKLIEGQGIKLPFYIGGMIVAAVVRNIEDMWGVFRVRQELIDAIGETCLTLFIAVSMMSLELWNVAAVAGPLLTNIAVQAALVCILAGTIVFRLSGRDYDAAVMSGGLVGFMMGTTANALANMNAIVQRFGPAPRAFLVVPLVGACFIDFVNAVIISIMVNLFT